jgi:tetratricopeptide (TPR) repeat protein
VADRAVADTARTVRQAIAALKAGNLAGATAHLDTVLAAGPDNPVALHLMGVVHLMRRQPAAAIPYFDRALAAKPGSAEFLADRAIAHLTLGRKSAGVSDLEAALASNPKHERALYNLALARLEAREFDAAAELFRRVLRVNANQVDALVHLGVAEASAGRPRQAIPSLRRAVELASRHPLARTNLANALLEAGDPEAAAREYRAVIKDRPGDIHAHFGLGRALERLNRKVAAVEAYRATLAIEPRFTPAHVNLAAVFERLARFEEAEVHARQAVVLVPTDPEPALNLVQLLVRSARFDEAERELAALAARHGDRPNVLERQAMFYFRRRGAVEQGRAVLRRLLALAPRSVVGHELWAEDGNSEISEARLAEVVAWTETDRGLSAQDRGRLAYAAANVLNRLGRADESFAMLSRAKALLAPGVNYDPAVDQRITDQLIATFDAACIRDRIGWGDPSDRPIFVVGMPRSGTSLVEQIIASHPAMAGLGELPDLPDLADELAALHGGRIAGLAAATAEEFGAMAKRYLAKLATAPAAALRVVDKMPINFRHVGLIAVMFPGARIIHTRRDAMDTCVSIYRQNFEYRQPYAFDLRHLGGYYNQYERLMAHWAKVVPDRIVEVAYEKLTADLSGEARRLISACGVPWDERVVRFHESGHSVATASWWQVRQPIYRSAVGGWRKFEPWLGPLRESLSAQVADNLSST